MVAIQALNRVLKSLCATHVFIPIWSRRSFHSCSSGHALNGGPDQIKLEKNTRLYYGRLGPEPARHVVARPAGQSTNLALRDTRRFAASKPGVFSPSRVCTHNIAAATRRLGMETWPQENRIRNCGFVRIASAVKDASKP